jgi:hypothetical protein
MKHQSKNIFGGEIQYFRLEGMAEGPQPCYASYKYNPNFPTAYRPDFFLQTER